MLQTLNFAIPDNCFYKMLQLSADSNPIHWKVGLVGFIKRHGDKKKFRKH